MQGKMEKRKNSKVSERKREASAYGWRGKEAMGKKTEGKSVYQKGIKEGKY